MSCLADDSSLWATRLSYSTCSWGILMTRRSPKALLLAFWTWPKSSWPRGDSSTPPAVAPSRSAGWAACRRARQALLMLGTALAAPVQRSSRTGGYGYRPQPTLAGPPRTDSAFRAVPGPELDHSL